MTSLNGGDGQTRGSRRTLTDEADQVVAAANALPPVEGEPHCRLVGYATQLSLVFSYPDGRTVQVVVDRNCGTLFTRERSRAGLGPAELFDALWAAEHPGGGS